ncbi:MAG: Ig-like domain-containing protein [Clostridia bacterium]|nr:Ig-like domain-containing protein [Clostridia bacterium]
MKSIKKLAAIAMSACMVCSVPAFLAGCNDGDDGSDTSKTEGAVKIKNIADMSLEVGETQTITLSEYVTANGNAVTVSSAANGSVLTVSESGGVVSVQGKAKGVATVNIKCGAVELSFSVTVTEATQEKPAPVFEDLEKSVDLHEDALEVTLAPKSGGEDFDITYTLANNLIEGAEIKDGKLKYTPSAKGNVEISVNAKCVDKDNAQNVYDVNFKVKITVTENVVPVYYTVVIDGEARQVEHGATLKLPDRPKQEIESGKEFKGWQVGQEIKSGGSVITVTGPLEITAVIGDEPQAAPEKIKDGTAITFLLSESSATVNVAEYINTNGHAVSVSSSDEEVATVSESSGVVTVTAVAAGKTEVKLTCKDIEITFDVTVKNDAPTFENGTMSIDLYSPTGTFEIKPNGADTFTYEYSVSGATVSDGVLSYTASVVGTQTLTVNVTATDTATGAVEHATFTVTVNVFDTTAFRIINGGFEDGLNGWTVSALDGSAFNIEASWNVVQNTDAYWSGSAAYNNTGYHFNGLDGGIPEALTYKLTSTPFTIGGSGYISYKIGGRAAVVKIYDNATGVLLAEFANTAWADKGEPVGCIKDGKYNLTLLPYFADLSAYKGLEVYLVLEDALDGGWGHSVMDEVVTYYDKAPTTAKYDEVIEKCSEHNGETAVINWIKATNQVPVNRLQFTDKIQNSVAENGTVNLTSYLAEANGKVAGDANATVNKQIVKVQESDTLYTEGFTAFTLVAGKQYTVTYKLVSGEYEAEATFIITVKDNYQIVNGGFETGDLTGWTVVSGNIDISGGISGEAYHEWGEHMPYNKSGEYFCKNAGVAEGEAWELKSSVFTLSGNGHVSFKMGSHNAVVKVFLADGTQIYEYTCKTYHADDAAFPHFEQGANYITMLTHYADLTAYKGQELYITIGNNGSTGGFNFAHFDDIVTYYAEGEDMAAKKDNVLLTCTGKDVTHNDGETLEVSWIIAENEYNN